MDGANVASVSELIKQFALKEEQQQLLEKNGTNNGQTSGGPHVHLVRITHVLKYLNDSI